MLPSQRWTIGLMMMALAAVAPRCLAADEPPQSDPVMTKLHNRVTHFFDGVAAGDANAAFTELLAGSLLAEQAASVRSLVDKSKEIGTRYGNYRECEQVSAKRIGKDVVLMKYLYKCQKFPVVWYLAFYRDFARSAVTGDDYWVVVSLRFDTQLEGLEM